MDEIEFMKYEGLGNDFILIDDVEERLHLDASTIVRVCDRHFGVGADGLMLVRPSKQADARMLFYNPDGTEAEMCGNGVRAFAKHLYESGIAPSKSLSVETGAGVKTIDLAVEAGAVVAARVDMGTPSFASADIPVSLPTVEAIDVPLNVDGQSVTITCVSMGNPHCVLFVDDVATAPVEHLGRAIETMAIFPERTNVEFAQVGATDAISMRVWERGAGETLACGTGACAAAVAAARTGRTGRKVHVQLPGGELQVSWEEDSRIFMTGPAREVFRGRLDLDSFSSS